MNKRGHVLNAVLLSIGLGFLLEPAGVFPLLQYGPPALVEAQQAVGR